MYPFMPSASSLDALAPINPAPSVKLESMNPADRQRFRNAAFRAIRVYPGPVGALISDELLSWTEFGYRFGSTNRTMALVEHIEKLDLPTLAAQPAA
jgi:hypothetical protein